MSRMKWVAFAVCVLLAIVAAAGQGIAQQGKGGKGGKGGGPQPWRKGGGKGDMRLPQLQIEDAVTEGVYRVMNLLPATGEQPRLGLTDTMGYRLVGYEAEAHSLVFATVNLSTGALGSQTIRLPSEAPAFRGMPRMAADGGQHAVISQQAATLFVDVAAGRVRVAAGFDSEAPLPVTEQPRRDRRDWRRDFDRARTSQQESGYRIHGGAGGAHALAVNVSWSANSRQYTGSGATLHFAAGRSVSLSWSHSRYGVPPAHRDAVFAVTGDEIIVLTSNPQGEEGHELHCLVFDTRGNLKEAQTAPGRWQGDAAPRFALSPDGRHIVARPAASMSGYVYRRGVWEAGYKTDYTDPFIGFAPEGGIGVFLENLSPQRAALKAVNLESGEAAWATSVRHADAERLGDERPFSCVGPKAAAVASRFGIIAGEDSEEARFLYTAKVADFEPLSITYDQAGRLVAVLALDRVFVVDARTRNELHSIPFEEPLPAGSLGEFIVFDARSRKLLCCVRDRGVWLIDLASNSIETTLPPLPGNWARALPDLSGVVFSQPAPEGGNIMIQKLNGEPSRLYRCEFRDTQAVCLWISDRGNEFLVTERNVGTGRLFLINDKGDTVVDYNVADVDTMYVGDNTVTAFVTRRRQAVLINEISRWGFTGVNCIVINPGQGDPVDSLFSAVFRSEDLPGRSTYGSTAAAPFFGGLHFGDEKLCRFACPAGVLEADIARNRFTLHAWSRQPKGLAAVNPKGRDFFVAGEIGLTTYRLK
jgi:hypothetical protein